MPAKMKSFIHSALKLHTDDTGLAMGDVEITETSQFYRVREGKDNTVDMWSIDKQTQLNYLLLMAAEQGEFKNSFVYSALKLFEAPNHSKAYDVDITSDVQLDITEGYRKTNYTEHFDDMNRSEEINFLLLVAAAEGEI